MIVTFKNKNPELYALLQSWGYNLSVSEDLLLLWPPAYSSDDINYISHKNAFVYSTFHIQYGNANILDKYIHHISSNVSEIECKETTRIVQKNAEIALEFSERATIQKPLAISNIFERNFVIPKEGTYYKFTDDGVEKLTEGQKIILTPKTTIVEYQHNYPIRRILYKENENITLESRINNILSNYWVCEKYCGDTIEAFFETPALNEYLLRCKQKGFINSAILRILREE